MNDLSPNVYACEDVREVIKLHQDLFSDDFRQRPIREQLDRQARRIVEAHRSGDKAVVTHIKCWHSELVGHSVEEIMSHWFTLEDARQTIAREYGFTDWPDVEARGAGQSGLDFEAAVDALLEGNVDTLRRMLEHRPSLVDERSQYGHRSTLLHYVGSNGVETHRQVVPQNLAEVTQVLLDAGADVNATSEMYGGGSTTLFLLTTSSHPIEAGVVKEVAKLLIEAGADPE